MKMATSMKSRQVIGTQICRSQRQKNEMNPKALACLGYVSFGRERALLWSIEADGFSLPRSNLLAMLSIMALRLVLGVLGSFKRAYYHGLLTEGC